MPVPTLFFKCFYFIKFYYNKIVNINLSLFIDIRESQVVIHKINNCNIQNHLHVVSTVLYLKVTPLEILINHNMCNN